MFWIGCWGGLQLKYSSPSKVQVQWINSINSGTGYHQLTSSSYLLFIYLYFIINQDLKQKITRLTGSPSHSSPFDQSIQLGWSTNKKDIWRPPNPVTSAQNNSSWDPKEKIQHPPTRPWQSSGFHSRTYIFYFSFYKPKVITFIFSQIIKIYSYQYIKI